MVTRKKEKEAKVSWLDLRHQLNGFDRLQLLELIRDLYGASRENQEFLHTRFELGASGLDSYKKTIERWVFPDIYGRQDYSIAKAKKAISDYKKALGRPADVAELQVFFCERAAAFVNDCGLDDEGYYDALVRMFDQALKTIATFDLAVRRAYFERLKAVYDQCQDIGWGVGDDMADHLFKANK